jgi:glutamine---fructose-6-phosphate transaminase (isomerizing)
MVIEGGYLRDILAQPAALADTLDGLTPSALAQPANLWHNGRFESVVLTGMGGSYWALHPLHVALLQHRVHSTLLETSELIHVFPSLLAGRTLLIVASQSGRSAEIVRLLDEKPAGCFTLAITNTAGSPLEARADAVVHTRAGEESTVSSKTYVTALMASKWIADTLLELDLDASRRDLAAAAPAVAAYLQDWRGHVQALEAETAGVRDVFVLGRGASQATAGIGGLMIKESTHLHGEGMSAAAFRHGPWEMLHPALYALVMSGELATTLVHDIRAEGARAALVGEDADLPPFRLPRVDPSVRTILEILPVQMLTLALASLAGREAGKFERATKVTTTE